MLSEKLAGLLNEQVNFEWYSAYIYLDIYTYYEDKNLNGFGNWFNIQAQEERDHAMLFMKYIMNNGEKVKLTAIEGPTGDYKDFREPVVDAFNHEKEVTRKINAIYAVAYEEKDFRTMQFLDWFVKEQGEEEKNTEDIIKRYDLFGQDAKSLYMLDAELAGRVYAAPSLVL
jgi:ferritin